MKADHDFKIGAAVSEAVTTSEAIFDVSPLAGSGNNPSYPMTVEIQADGCDMYLRQGKSDVALDATAADNAKLFSGQSWWVTVEKEGDAYFAREAVSGSGTIRATRLDKVNA